MPLVDKPEHAQPDVSVVIPVYRNAPTLAELRERVAHALSTICASHEIVFVNDACPGDSLEVLEQLASEHSAVTVIDLAENVGQHQAVMLGLAHAQGRSVAIMDADLQDPPEALPGLLDGLGPGCDVVFAGRRGRYESGFRLLTSRMFKSVLHLLSGVPADAGLYVALSRAAVERLLEMQGPRPFVVAMIGCTGLAMTSIPVERNQRPLGDSAYSFRMRLASAWRGIWWTLCWQLALQGWPHREPRPEQANLSVPVRRDAPGCQSHLVVPRIGEWENE